MLHNISWQGYWIFIALSLVVYYLAVVSLYFSSEVKRALKLSPVPQGDKIALKDKSPLLRFIPSYREEGQAPNIYAPSSANDEEEKRLALFFTLLNEIEAFLEGGEGKKWTQEYILTQLNSILDKYPEDLVHKYAELINKKIDLWAKSYCGYSFNSMDKA